MLRVRVFEGAMLRVLVPDALPELEALLVSEALLLGVCVSEAVPLCVEEGVPLCVEERVPVCVAEGVSLCVEEEVPVCAEEEVGVGATLLVMDGEGDEERLRMVAMLRPR